MVKAMQHSLRNNLLRRIWGLFLLSASTGLGGMTALHAQTDSVANFYRGKTVYVVAGDAAGGGFDAYARLVARHLGDHIPGHPGVVVQNMEGGGSFLAGEHVAVSAPADGTYIGAIHPTVLLDPVMGDPKKGVKRLDLAYLGSAAKNLSACFVRTDSPVHSFPDMFQKELIVGAGNQASTTREFAAMLKNLLGAKLKISAGYTGNADIYLAVDRGEVQGMCGTGADGVKALRPNWMKDNFAEPIVQESIEGDPDLNAMHVPLILSFVKDDEQRQILTLYYSQQEFGRPYVISTKVPADRKAALQTAFLDTLKDPELLADAQKAKLMSRRYQGLRLKLS